MVEASFQRRSVGIFEVEKKKNAPFRGKKMKK
jgi:hypothetical protein